MSYTDTKMLQWTVWTVAAVITMIAAPVIIYINAWQAERRAVRWKMERSRVQRQEQIQLRLVLANI